MPKLVSVNVHLVENSVTELCRVLLEDRPKQPKRLRVDLVLFSGGRDANTESLKCDAVDVKIGRYGRVVVDADCRTSNPDIFAGT